MSIRVSCPKCGNVLNAPDAAAGKRGKCAKCGAAVQIPTASAPPPAPAPARVVKATPIAPPKPPADESYDIEIEDEPPPKPAKKADAFDVEVEEDAPPPPPRRPVAPPPPPVNHNPFAFGPPPDSAAAKLKPVSVDVSDPEPDEQRPPMHPGWRSVADGLGALKRSTQIGFIVVILVALTAAAAGSGAGVITFVVAGFAALFSLISTIFLVLGLVKCLKMPEPEDGGSGRSLALYALIATGASLLCGLPGLAVPFLLGAFLRAIGKGLPSPPTVQAATRFMVASGLAVVVSLFAPLVNFAIVPATLAAGGSADTVILLVILVSVFALVVTMVALMMYLAALSTGETAIQSVIRVRGVGQPPKRKPQRAARGRRDDEDDEDEHPAQHPAKKKAARDDDYNPFA